MQKQAKRIIMLIDCQSFYATVEKTAHPDLEHRPLVVAGDPERRSGIILAACPLAKSFGVTTAQRLGEALSKCPDLAVVRPRMEEYIRISLQMTHIYTSFTDLVEPYSIDEQFLDVTGTLHLFGGDPAVMAASVQQRVMRETGIRVRVGIGSNKVLSKMACDYFAKRSETGIYELHKNKLADTLWPLHISNMLMVGRRMARRLEAMGVHTIGQLAETSLAVLKRRWGVNGEVLWRIANGIDDSPVSLVTHDTQKQIGHHMTLPYDYKTIEELKVPLLELTELVCQQARAKGMMGQIVTVSCRGADYDRPTGFHRQRKLNDPTYVAVAMYKTVMELFLLHWDSFPVRSIGVSLGELVSDQVVQLAWFDPYKEQLALERVTDQIKVRYGNAAIMRASSVTASGQARDRAGKIGGHYK